jgi:hypothetical protein
MAGRFGGWVKCPNAIPHPHAAMSRFKRIRDWPEKLQRLSLEDLRKELVYWQQRIKALEFEKMPRSKAFEKRVREVQREIDSREAS